jgi:site-specific DNA recombinase
MVGPTRPKITVVFIPELNAETRSIDVDPERAPMVKRIFELYASGEHSLITLRKAVLNELGLRLSRSYFEKVLKNRFYLGSGLSKL